jgi:hypothetical protein
MMSWRKMFCKIIRQVCVARSPVDMKLFLSDAVLYLIEAHVHGLGSLLFESFIGESHGHRVVDLDRCIGGCLWPISSRVLRRATAVFMLLNMAPHLASAAEASVLHMMVAVLRMALFPASG